MEVCIAGNEFKYYGLPFLRENNLHAFTEQLSKTARVEQKETNMNPPFTLAIHLRLFTRPWRSDSSRELCSCWAEGAEITLNLAEVVRMQALGIWRRGSTFRKHLQRYACTFSRVLGSDSAARAKNKSHRPRSERLMQGLEIVKVLRFFCAGIFCSFSQSRIEIQLRIRKGQIWGIKSKLQ